MGLDLGGTNVRWALVDRRGDILEKWEKATADLTEQESLINGLARMLRHGGTKGRGRGG